MLWHKKSYYRTAPGFIINKFKTKGREIISYLIIQYFYIYKNNIFSRKQYVIIIMDWFYCRVKFFPLLPTRNDGRGSSGWLITPIHSGTDSSVVGHWTSNPEVVGSIPAAVNYPRGACLAWTTSIMGALLD